MLTKRSCQRNEAANKIKPGNPTRCNVYMHVMRRDSVGNSVHM